MLGQTIVIGTLADMSEGNSVSDWSGAQQVDRTVLADAPTAGWYPDPRGGGQRWWDGAAWTSHQRNTIDPLDTAEVDALAPVQPVIPGLVEAGPAAKSPTSGESDRPSLSMASASSFIPASRSGMSSLPVAPAMALTIGGSVLVLVSLVGQWLRSPVGAYNAFAVNLPWFGTGGSHTIVEGVIVASSGGSLAHGWLLAGLAVLAAGCLAVWDQRWSAPLLTALGFVAFLIVAIDLVVLRSGLSGLTGGVGLGWAGSVALLGSLGLLGGGIARLVETTKGSGDD